MNHRTTFALLLVLLSLAASSGAAQEPRTGLEIAGIPAINYDADEGLGYGAIVELYSHGAGVEPYRFTLQPTLFFTTGGRRDLTLFFDAPRLLPGGWRADVYLGSERQLASPYYGMGNESLADPAREDDPANPYFYRFGRTRLQATGNLQHALGSLPLKALVGAGVVHSEIDPVPNDSGTTLLAAELASRPGEPAPGGYSNFVRGGLVWDTRDRESGPTRGTWSELLVQRVDEALGSETGYTRWTATDRRYLPVRSERLVLANRILLQGVEGAAPFYDLQQVQTSFKQQEGLGGAKSVRGLPKNRYVGKGLFLWNAELRWRAADVTLRGKPSRLVLSGFVDSGRVWAGRPRATELLSGLHQGYGAGARLATGENFVIAVDVAHSAESTAPFYIGLGYLF
jgi:hypothetical protein